MHDEMQPDNQLGSDFDRGGDREGAMMKADLFKLANYSLKLFKKVQDDDQFESWVQAKVTKAADYIASVYHYLEYEMKFSEYAHQLEQAEMMSEDAKVELKNKLMEAKAKIKDLKKAQVEKAKKKEKKVEEGFGDNAKVGDTFKTQHGTATKTSTGVKHTRDAKPEDDEDYVPPKKEKKTAMTGAERREQKAKDKEQEKSSKEYEKKNPGSVKRYVDGKLVNEADKGDMDHDGKDEPDSKEYMDNKDAAIKKAMGKKDKKVDEESKPDFLDMDKDGDKKEPMKKAVADKKKGAVKEASTGDYSAKKAAAGKDIGKPGKNFEKIAKKAEAGGAKSGEAVAGAVLKKLRAKESAEPQSEMIAESAEVSRLKELTQRLLG